jgi:uncharacterized caspase-like protein
MANTSSTETETRYAICVGVNNYQPTSGLNSLQYAEKDAQDVYDLLIGRGFAPENCRLLLGEGATLSAINSALREVLVKKAKRDDLIIFFFAGHGCRVSYEDEDEDESGSEVFLASQDFDANEIKGDRSHRLDEALGLNRLRAAFFERTRSNKLLFIFDSCHSGDFAGSGYRNGDDIQPDMKQAFDGKKAGRVALTSCSPNERAFESDELEQGFFTHYLLQGLDGTVGAVEEDGWLTASSLHGYICRAFEQQGRKSQKPNLYCNQQGRFQLLHYPSLATTNNPTAVNSNTQSSERAERLRQRLSVDRDRLLDDRLASFASGTRQKELVEVEQLIKTGQEQPDKGCYVIITGQAGEGKTSLIAQMIATRYDRYTTPYHFIPFSPGGDHQITLLHSLMASLALKHPELSDYWTNTTIASSLADTFGNMLRQLSELGRKETIFIDGLDQIKADGNMQDRDLSFLPTQLPVGMVVVIGTRPDDTLLPLDRKTPQKPYNLPHLSLFDFGLMLAHKGVKLSEVDQQKLYEALQGNAFDLELAARILFENTDENSDNVIKQILQHPEYLLDFRLDPLRARSDWTSVLKPVLGCLLATVETQPLSEKQLVDILQLDIENVSKALNLLGGLIGSSDRQGEAVYYLYHLKLIDYLKADNNKPGQNIFGAAGLRRWHAKLADWCGLNGWQRMWQDVATNSVEQSRREYARDHFVIHLSVAERWEELFVLLDDTSYCQAKLRHDPSTRRLALDLLEGQKAAARLTENYEEGLANLPYLWRYTLLRASLASQSDQLPVSWFEGMTIIGQEQEVIGRAELLTIWWGRVSRQSAKII